ncbi:MAG TPA: HAMP domain-containing sensor histidine kinase [Chloroflexota bacterium]|nr:HAMP domain-containing sensor histidine kinase [Chloroflexota bacterium]
MSTDRREHHPWLHHHIWQDSPHLGPHALLTLCQRVRAHAVVPDRLPWLWRHPLLGYLVAVLAQLAAVGLTLHLATVVPDFWFRGALSFLAVTFVALRWGVGPGLLSTLMGSALLNDLILPPYAAWSLAAPGVVKTLLFLSVGLTVSVLAGRAARYARIYASEREQREKVETAVRMRDDILNLGTHDLRSPATSVLSRARLVQHRLHRGLALDAGWLDAQMQAIGEAIARLNATIDEMSDVARLQVGQALDLQLEDLDASAVVRAVAAEYNVVAEAPRVAVQAPAAAVLVCGDRVRLLRMLHNLIGNAVKYSSSGTAIDVDVQTQEQQAVITVRDQGVGIPTAELPHIFTRFFRASTALGVQGTGIGLAGSRAIVEQHHGHITVESEVGQGTTVMVCLPRSADESNRAGVAVTSASAPTKTLPG